MRKKNINLRQIPVTKHILGFHDQRHSEFSRFREDVEQKHLALLAAAEINLSGTNIFASGIIVQPGAQAGSSMTTPSCRISSESILKLRNSPNMVTDELRDFAADHPAVYRYRGHLLSRYDTDKLVGGMLRDCLEYLLQATVTNMFRRARGSDWCQPVTLSVAHRNGLHTLSGADHRQREPEQQMRTTKLSNDIFIINKRNPVTVITSSAISKDIGLRTNSKSQQTTNTTLGSKLRESKLQCARENRDDEEEDLYTDPWSKKSKLAISKAFLLESERRKRIQTTISKNLEREKGYKNVSRALNLEKYHDGTLTNANSRRLNVIEAKVNQERQKLKQSHVLREPTSRLQTPASIFSITVPAPPSEQNKKLYVSFLSNSRRSRRYFFRSRPIINYNVDDVFGRLLPEPYLQDFDYDRPPDREENDLDYEN
ncbi:hypothetical protein TWF694_006099 [Orbilia ellipsospora]|uniref:Uncharacterized protein n=1 Tax=Orbilia ellipsospora TaxID=2528407 RepID=A0AAV9WR85_9PEZI